METKDRPFYYGGVDNPYEARKILEVWNLGFNLTNALKYVLRLGKKDDNAIELNKIRNYLLFELERLPKLKSMPQKLEHLWPKNIYGSRQVIESLKTENAHIQMLINGFYRLTWERTVLVDKECLKIHNETIIAMIKVVEKMIELNERKNKHV